MIGAAGSRIQMSLSEGKKILVMDVEWDDG